MSGKFRSHVVEQISGRLWKKAIEAHSAENYYEVIKIGATQFPYNVCGAGIYYNLSKGDTYDRVQRLASIALETGVPEKVRATAIIAELELLSRHYANYFNPEFVGEWSADNIKQ